MPDEGLQELRFWPDTPETRKKIYEHEARDQSSANAWDRVVKAILGGSVDVTPEPGARVRGPVKSSAAPFD